MGFYNTKQETELFEAALRVQSLLGDGYIVGL